MHHAMHRKMTVTILPGTVEGFIPADGRVGAA
jgi:hypothetical protein